MMGGEFNYDILLRTFVNVTMYSQNNNNTINKKRKNVSFSVIKAMNVERTALSYFISGLII
jgi:hypothetical protein